MIKMSDLSSLDKTDSVNTFEHYDDINNENLEHNIKDLGRHLQKQGEFIDKFNQLNVDYQLKTYLVLLINDNNDR